MPEKLDDYKRLLGAIEARIGKAQPPLVLAIAGPPATGKSTLAEKLTDDLRASGQTAAYCPMDGFHKTNAQLDAEGLRSVKGRIDTFNSGAFAEAVARLSSGDAFWWPRYSRHTHEPVPEGTRIEGGETVCIIEGNYILMNDAPWKRAWAYYDLRIFVDAPDSLLMQRLTKRHMRGGKSQSETYTKIAQIDMPNAEKIRESAEVPDILFQEAVDA